MDCEREESGAQKREGGAGLRNSFVVGTGTEAASSGWCDVCVACAVAGE